MRLRKTGSILVLSCSLAAASLDEPLNTGTHRSPTRSTRPQEGEDDVQRGQEGTIPSGARGMFL